MCVYVGCDAISKFSVMWLQTPCEKEDKVKLEEEVKQGRVRCDLSGKKGNTREYSIIRQETVRKSDRLHRKQIGEKET